MPRPTPCSAGHPPGGLKSVNGRGLDIRTRLAPGLDAFDIPIRQAWGRRSRAAFGQCRRVLGERQGATGAVSVNPAALETILAAISALSGRVDARRPGLDGIWRCPAFSSSKMVISTKRGSNPS